MCAVCVDPIGTISFQNVKMRSEACSLALSGHAVMAVGRKCLTLYGC
jgi:hypothetical protein